MASVTPTAGRSFPSWALPGGRSGVPPVPSTSDSATEPTSRTPAAGATRPGAAGPASRRAAGAAAVLGVIGGLLVLVAAVALPAAILTIDRIGVSLDAIERRQLDLALAVAPSVAIAGLVHLAAAWAVAARLPAARYLGTAVGGVGAVLALAWVAAIAAGRDPISGPGTGSAADGIGILVATAIVYASVVAALVSDRPGGAPAEAHGRAGAA